jgi:membrane-bound lytic murein transglycosylase D
MTDFIHNEDTLFSMSRQHRPNNFVTRPVTELEYFDIGSIEGKTKISYMVKSGDNPGYIADWFDISVSELRLWNRIHRNIIRVGQKLVIFVPNDKVEYYKKINNLSFVAKQELSGRKVETAPNTTSVVNTSANTQIAPTDDQFIYYTVQNGDNFWTIAKKFSGVTNTDIMQLNNISDARSLKTGQRLKIKPKS